MTSKKALIISICIFMIVGMIALLLILNKGHIGSIGLVNLNETSAEVIMPKLEISAQKQYISSKDEESTPLSATIDGEVIADGIVYKSSDEEIAIIEDGEVVAVDDGKVIITGTYQGQSATTEVEVITPIKSISFTSTSRSIRVGKDLQMKLQAKPSDANINTLKYSSSDESIATVNANGIVTGVSAGKVTITVTDEYTGIEKSVDLTIRK